MFSTLKWTLRKKLQELVNAVSRARKKAEILFKRVTSPVLSVASCGEAMSELKKGAFDGEEENGASGVNTGFDKEVGRERQERDVTRGAEFAHEMDDELVAQVNAVGDAREERGAGHFDSPERQTWTDGAKEKRGHSESD